MKDFDLVAKAGGPKHALVIELHDIPVTDNLVVELVPSKADADPVHQPLLSGIEVVRSNAKEIIKDVAVR